MKLPIRAPLHAAVRPVIRLCLLALALAAAPGRAADPADSPSREAIPKWRTGAKPEVSPSSPPGKPAVAAPRVQSGLDALRERLAGALSGADGKAGAAAPPMLKIVNRSQTPAAVSAAPDPRTPPTRARDQPRATRTAAAEPAALVPGSVPRLIVARRDEPVLPAAGDAPAATASTAWAYHGANGPQAWADLHPDFALCATGRRQSPIDLRDGLKLQLEPIVFGYGASPVKVVDTGRTVQVDVGPGNRIAVMGRSFELQHVRFHMPSEERIDGRRFEMSAQLVHRDDQGRLAIVTVLLAQGAGQPLVQTVWNNLPLEKGTAQPVSAPLDPSALLPAERGYFAYMGSLSTPPCTEDVLRLVMKTPVEISAAQLAIFERLYPMNARPLQAVAGRMIKESE